MLTEKQVRQFIEAVLPAESGPMSAAREQVDRLGYDHEEIFPSQMALLRALCVATRPRQLLELGTFLGYSTIGLAEIIKNDLPGSHLISVERDPSRIRVARSLLEAAGLIDVVTLIEGDAWQICRDLMAKDQRYDFIFLDTFEGEYPRLYEACVELLNPGGVLIVDNVLMQTVQGWNHGANVVEDGTDDVASALRQLLAIASRDPRIAPAIVPLGSGLLLAVKRP